MSIERQILDMVRPAASAAPATPTTPAPVTPAAPAPVAIGGGGIPVPATVPATTESAPVTPATPAPTTPQDPAAAPVAPEATPATPATTTTPAPTTEPLSAEQEDQLVREGIATMVKAPGSALDQLTARGINIYEKYTMVRDLERVPEQGGIGERITPDSIRSWHGAAVQSARIESALQSGDIGAVVGELLTVVKEDGSADVRPEVGAFASGVLPALSINEELYSMAVTPEINYLIAAFSANANNFTGVDPAVVANAAELLRLFIGHDNGKYWLSQVDAVRSGNSVTSGAPARSAPATPAPSTAAPSGNPELDELRRQNAELQARIANTEQAQRNARVQSVDAAINQQSAAAVNEGIEALVSETINKTNYAFAPTVGRIRQELMEGSINPAIVGQLAVTNYNNLVNKARQAAVSSPQTYRSAVQAAVAARQSLLQRVLEYRRATLRTSLGQQALAAQSAQPTTAQPQPQAAATPAPAAETGLRSTSSPTTSVTGQPPSKPTDPRDRDSIAQFIKELARS